MRSLEWWLSDEAKDHRAAMYLAAMLWSLGARRQAFHDVPEWPALFHYDPESDAPYWIEVKVPTHARDYMRGCSDGHMNEAAKQLAAE